MYCISYLIQTFFLFQNTCEDNPISARPHPARSSTMVSHSSIATLMNAPFEDSKAPIPSPTTPEPSARKRVTFGIDSSPGSRPGQVSHSSGAARLKRSRNHLKSCSTSSIATLMNAPFATAPLAPEGTPEPPARKGVTFGIDSSPGSRPDQVSHSSGAARLKRSRNHLKSCSTSSIATLMNAPFATAKLAPEATPEPPARKGVTFGIDSSPGSRPDQVSHSSGAARLKRSRNHLKSCSTSSIATLMNAPFATAPLAPEATPEPPARKRVKFDIDSSPEPRPDPVSYTSGAARFRKSRSAPRLSRSNPLVPVPTKGAAFSVLSEAEAAFSLPLSTGGRASSSLAQQPRHVTSGPEVCHLFSDSAMNTSSTAQSPVPTPALVTSLQAEEPLPINVLKRELEEVQQKVDCFIARQETLEKQLVATLWTPVKIPLQILHQNQELALVKQLEMNEKKKVPDLKAAIKKAKDENFLKEHRAELEELFMMEE